MNRDRTRIYHLWFGALYLLYLYNILSYQNYIKNRQKRLKEHKNWKLNNKQHCAYYERTRVAKKLRACPNWVDQNEIKQRLNIDNATFQD